MRGRKTICIVLFIMMMLSLFLFYQEEAEALTVDYIVLTESPNGTVLTTVVLEVGGKIKAYASGYNSTSGGYVGLVEVNWIEPLGLGSFDNLTGTSTTFTAGFKGGTTIITGENLSLPSPTDDFVVNILPPTIDYINITDSPNGIELTTVILPFWGSITSYASGYNSTGPTYIKLVEVNWSAIPPGLGSFDNLTGTSTTFTAGGTPGIVNIIGQNLSMGPPVSDDYTAVIMNLTVDYINITNGPNGAELTTVILPLWGSVTAYASGYNSTYAVYVGLVEVDWSADPPGLGSFNTTLGVSTTFTAGGTPGTVNITGQNLSMVPPVSDNFTVIIMDMTVDYIIITDKPNGAELTTVTLPLWGLVTAYASGYNATYAAYVGLVEVKWSGPGGSWFPMIGNSSTFIAGNTSGLYTQLAENATLRVNDTFDVLINPPPIELILLTYTPNGIVIPNITRNVGDPLLIYASGYSKTGAYLGLVNVTWTDTPDLGDFDNLTGTSSTFTGTSIGLTTIKGEYGTLNDTFKMYLIPPPGTVDYINITDAPNGSALIMVTLPIGGEVTVYSSGYNISIGYVGLVDVNWSAVPPGLGSFNNITGTSTTFTAGGVAGIVNITGENLSMTPQVSDNFTIQILDLTVDYIIITDAPNGAELLTIDLPIGGSIRIYASGYNTTYAVYVDLVEVNWSESVGLGSFDNLTDTSSTFTAGFVDGLTTIKGENLTLGLNDTFDVNIIPPTADYIQIRTQPGGGGINLSDPVNFISYPVGASDTYYGAMYNHTAGYFDDAPSDATWFSSDPSIVNVSSPGSFSNITCDEHNWGGPITITLSASGKQNTTQVTVVEPTVDYIQIRDEPNGLGNIVTIRTYIVWQVDEFYAAGYNYTADYLHEVESIWWSNDTSVGKVTSPGLWTNFTAQKVKKDTICHVTADYNGIQNSTGVLNVLAPRIDFIVIVDASNGGGNWVTGKIYDEGDNDTFWAAGYNFTADYIKDVKAVWESNNTIVGKVTYGPNEFTDFSAGWRGGYCKVKATYGALTNETGSLFVININQLPSARTDYYNETGFSGGNFSFSTDITLRVTGRKKNFIKMELEEDGVVIKSVEVTRSSNQPDIGILSHDLDAHKVYRVILNYNGINGGSNPIIVTFEFLGNIYSVHLLFNSQEGTQQKAIIEFNDILPLVGVVFFDGFRSTDFEGYLVDYQWDFGDGTSGNGETLAHSYEENGIYTVVLTVTDDEGGIDKSTITAHVNNIDNNNQANAIPGQKGAKGFLNNSGQYVVILQCPADLMITNFENQQIGLLYRSQINNIEGAFIAMLFSDVEVYFIPRDEIYTFEVNGYGSGVYNLSIIGISNDITKKYGVYDVTCSENTLDTYLFNFEDDKISLSTNEDDKIYSLEFLFSLEEHWDRFNLINMKLNNNAIHIYKINTWGDLDSNKPLTLFVDENKDGKIDNSLDLESGLTGDDVEALLLKRPVTEPVFPLLLFIIIGSICAIGVGSLLTEIGKLALLTLFLPLYTRIKKEELLDQPTRYKIYGYIIGNPGAHFGLIKEELELGSGQLVYHLRQLRDANLIYSRADGVKKRFYPAHTPKPKRGIPNISDFQEKILGIIKNNSGIGQKKLASSMGISRQVAGYHLTIMEKKGFIKKKVIGRETKYYPS